VIGRAWIVGALMLAGCANDVGTIECGTTVCTDYLQCCTGCEGNRFCSLTCPPVGDCPDAGAGPGPTDDAGPAPGDAGGVDAGEGDAGDGLEAPGPPGPPTFSDITESSVTLAWSAPIAGGAVATYVVERAPDMSGAPGPFADAASGITEPSFVDADRAADTTYWYRIRGVNPAGDGAPSDAASVTTAAPIAVTPVQTAAAEGFDPVASFADAPLEGNLLVAVAFMRRDTANPDIAGWDELFYTHFITTGTTDRRGLAMFARVAGPDEARDVRLDWDPDRESRLLVAELSAGAPVTWTPHDVVFDDSATDLVQEIAIASSSPPAVDQLWLGALGTRNDPGPVSFDGMTVARSELGARTAALAFAQRPGGVAASTTARWTTNRHATVGLAVYSMTRR